MRSFRSRLFVLLAIVALVPSALALIVGTLALREVVITTGTVGAWEAVAGSGRELSEEILLLENPPPGLVEAAERHLGELSESASYSRLYAFLGERILALLPWFSVSLLLTAAILAFLAARRFSRNFSTPLEELAGWTRALGAGRALPPPDRRKEGKEVREFQLLRGAMRDAAQALARARTREEERVRTQAWSEMARKVAHELRNPLTPMRMAAARIAEAGDPEIATSGEILREEVDRLDALARSFAHFGRPPEGPTSVVDLGELLGTLTERLSTEDAPITFERPGTPIEVHGHLDALERVVRNLVVNAQEATRTSARRSNGAEPVAVRVDASGEAAEIWVSDRGEGIPDGLLDRIWEPDFTTKGSGTGLGLAMARQAVRAHGGEIEARNRPRGGAEFRVRLPRRSGGLRNDGHASGEEEAGPRE